MTRPFTNLGFLGYLIRFLAPCFQPQFVIDDYDDVSKMPRSSLSKRFEPAYDILFLYPRGWVIATYTLPRI